MSHPVTTMSHHCHNYVTTLSQLCHTPVTTMSHPCQNFRLTHNTHTSPRIVRAEAFCEHMRARAFRGTWYGLSWDFVLPLSKNFDGLSLTGGKILAFKISLDNGTNLKTKIQFSLASYIWWCWFQRVKPNFFLQSLWFSKQISNENVSAPVKDNLSKFSLKGRTESQLSPYHVSRNALARTCSWNASARKYARFVGGYEYYVSNCSCHRGMT